MKMANNSTCEYQPMSFLSEKFVLVGVLGAVISLLGMGMNFVVAFVLGKLIYHYPTPLIYLFTLALIDLLFCFEYIILLSVQIYFDYFNWLQLYVWWSTYSPTALTLSKVLQTASTYLIVVASVERFMDVGGFNGSTPNCTNQSRLLVISAVVAFSILFRFPSFWEIELVEVINCTGFSRFHLDSSKLAKDPLYKFYSFYTVNILQVFLPFALLILLNFGIIYRIRGAMKQEEAILFRRQSAWQAASKQESLRAATRMLGCVVATYLLSNILSLTITIMEHSNREFLQSHNQFYTFSVDCISLLYVLTAATRLLIYVSCSEKIRREVSSLFMLEAKPEVSCYQLSEMEPLKITLNEENYIDTGVDNFEGV